MCVCVYMLQPYMLQPFLVALAAAAPRAQPPLKAEALYTGLPPASGLYAPFVHRTFELLDEAAVPLAPYPSPGDLQLLRGVDRFGEKNFSTPQFLVPWVVCFLSFFFLRGVCVSSHSAWLKVEGVCQPLG